MIGVFCFEATWASWPDQEMATELGQLGALGVTAIVTETIEPARPTGGRAGAPAGCPAPF